MALWLATVFCTWFSMTCYAQDFTTHVFKQADTTKLQLDVFRPASAGNAKMPVIIFFHGGGLINGNREQMYPQCKYFAAHGFVTVTADYRLLKSGPKAADPKVGNCIKDAKSAVRWVKLHAAEYNIDTTKVILGGGSSGGFLATEAALNTDINDAADSLSVSTRAVMLMLFNPAYIPAARYAPDAMQYAGKNTPPAILFYGDKDPYKPGGDQFYNQLNKAHVTTELWVAKGETHSFFNKTNWQQATCAKALEFLIKAGLAKGAAPADLPDASLILQTPDK